MTSTFGSGWNTDTGVSAQALTPSIQLFSWDNGYTVRKEERMKMKHTVKLVSGETKEYIFKTSRESTMAFTNCIILNETFKTIKCIWIEPLNKPEERKRIDLM